MQDFNRIVTVEDLIRRYNLDGLKVDRNNISLLDKELTKTDGIIQDFVAQTTKDIQDIQNQLDGNITSWFYDYDPTLNNEPAVNWTTDALKEEHLGDLFYNNDEGTAFRFIIDNNVYQWKQLTDDAAARALAVANSALDTADSKRRVFVVQPTPPYDVGDIWWTANELYRCRVGRLEGDVFAQADWINDLKYTDDTTANQVQANLDTFEQVVGENYATTAQLTTQTDKIKSDVTELQEITTTRNNEFITYKNEVSSQFQQQANSFELSLNTLNESINETRDIAQSNSTQEYLRFSQGTGVEIGSTNSPFKVNITNNEFNIQDNGNKIAYINDKKLFITESEILQKQYLGNFAFIVNQDNSLSLRKVRDE